MDLLLVFDRLSSSDEAVLRHGMFHNGATWARLLGFAAVLALSTAPTGTASEDVQDRALVQSVVNRVLEKERTGTSVPWSNAETGSAGMVTITRTYYRGDGVPCREYGRTLERPGEATVVVRGTGCRNRDAIWSLDEQAPETEPVIADEAPAPPPPADKTFDVPPPKPEPPAPVAEPPVASAPPAVPIPDVAPAPPPPPAKIDSGPVRLSGDIPSRSEE